MTSKISPETLREAITSAFLFVFVLCDGDGATRRELRGRVAAIDGWAPEFRARAGEGVHISSPPSVRTRCQRTLGPA